MRFSLVVATLGRDADIAALLDTLLAQGRLDFEVILVDQNDDDRLGPIEAAYASRVTLRRLRSSVRNANHARNLGLRHARGEIVTFPTMTACIRRACWTAWTQRSPPIPSCMC
jgi:glycosyltransferase involved in cell wall biosynthesis